VPSARRQDSVSWTSGGRPALSLRRLDRMKAMSGGEVPYMRVGERVAASEIEFCGPARRQHAARLESRRLPQPKVIGTERRAFRCAGNHAVARSEARRTWPGSLIVAMARMKCTGGSSWPVVIGGDKRSPAKETERSASRNTPDSPGHFGR